MRLTHFYFLKKESDGWSNNIEQKELQSYFYSVGDEA